VHFSEEKEQDLIAHERVTGLQPRGGVFRKASTLDLSSRANIHSALTVAAPIYMHFLSSCCEEFVQNFTASSSRRDQLFRLALTPRILENQMPHLREMENPSEDALISTHLESQS
jgi:hypothetical protein